MLKDIEKERTYAQFKVKCKCGHVVAIPVYVDETICTWCKHKLKNNTKEHFKYKLRKEKEK